MQSSNPSDSAHLSPERLAAFDDGPFGADEVAHLAACAVCRAEYESMQAVVGLAGQVGAREPLANAPRLVEFEAILAGVKQGWGLPVVERSAPVAAPAVAGTRPRTPRMAIMPLMRRAAAALLLVGGGAVLGRMSGEAGPGVASAALGAPLGAPLGVTATPASFGDRPFADASYGSVEQATIALNEAQREYERASLWLASNDTTIRDPEVFRARLAALDQMMEASRVALRDAPQDPVLNHYYLAAYSAREATLQALSSALPVDKIIERY